MSSGISFSGLSSGVDTNSIVKQLMALERQPITKIESQKSKVTARQSVHQEINTLLKTLRDKAKALLDTSAFAAKSATSSDAAIASATADSTAAAGAYNLVVTGLAKAHTTASGASPAISADTLHLTVGSTTVNVSVAATDTLQGVADKINGTSDTPVSASVVNNKLVLISKTTGATGGITVTSDAGLAGALGMTTTQAATDATVTMNGLAVTASGNTITNAVNGVTITLAKEGSTTVTVALDTKAIETKVKEFVDAYNAVNDNLSRATKYDTATKQAGTLQGDQALQSMLSQIRTSATAQVGALSGGTYDQLAQIGITTATDRSGRLVIDSSKLQKALLDNLSAVQNVFTKDDGNAVKDTNDGVAVRLSAMADSFSTGTLEPRLKGFTDTLGRMDKKIADLEVVMTLKERRLKAQFAAMESAISRMKSQSVDFTSQLG
ncbi:MAG: flagellar filament capping protein FliD [Actinomycetota bacterium]